MISFKLSGKVEHVGNVTTFASGFTKRDIIVDTAEPNAKYPNPVRFSFKRDNCSKLDGVRAGDVVEIEFTVDGRKFDGAKGAQYFVDLTGQFIRTTSSAGGCAAASAQGSPAASDDGMPF